MPVLKYSGFTGKKQILLSQHILPLLLQPLERPLTPNYPDRDDSDE